MRWSMNGFLWGRRTPGPSLQPAQRSPAQECGRSTFLPGSGDRWGTWPYKMELFSKLNKYCEMWKPEIMVSANDNISDTYRFNDLNLSLVSTWEEVRQIDRRSVSPPSRSELQSSNGQIFTNLAVFKFDNYCKMWTTEIMNSANDNTSNTYCFISS